MKNDEKIQARIPIAVFELIETTAKKWEMTRSELIRLVLETFCQLDPQEQATFFRKAAEKKFSPK
jgi:hypothetical protein